MSQPNNPRHSKILRRVMAMLVLVLAGWGGLHFLAASQAATFTGSAEAETGSMSGKIQSSHDALASNAAAVSFGVFSSPSGQPLPQGNLPGWKQVFAEDFNKDSALGSWAGNCTSDSSDKVVYTGASGTMWHAYPDCFLDTRNKFPYRSDKVLSTHDGQLDFYLHQVDGKAAGANPSPVINNGVYQTYGRYSARLKLSSHSMSSYYIAWLLWPQDEAAWQCAESDFPETALDSPTLNAYAHYGCAGQQNAYSAEVDMTQWHTYTQEWSPGQRKYYIDDKLIGTSNSSVYAKPQRWQLQTETIKNSNDTGHLLVDWVVVYANAP